MRDHGVIRHEDDFAIGRVLVHREGRDDVDRIADRDASDVSAHGIDDTGRLVAEARGELHRLDIIILAPHRFGAVDADRLDLDADLGRAWSRNCGVDEFEDVRSADLRELDCAWHWNLLRWSEEK